MVIGGGELESGKCRGVKEGGEESGLRCVRVG
jgi:hypothetical protein